MCLVSPLWKGGRIGCQGDSSSSRPRETASCALGAILLLLAWKGLLPVIQLGFHTAFSASVSQSLGEFIVSNEETNLVDFGACPCAIYLPLD